MAMAMAFTLPSSSSSSSSSASASASASSSLGDGAALFRRTPIHLPRSSSSCLRFRCSLLENSSVDEAALEERSRRGGGYGFHSRTVSVFWDLDNKPPPSSPYEAALNLREAASRFGSVVEMVAYANRHAFLHIPEWVRKERRERKELDALEQKGMVVQEQPYTCGLCGRKCRTNVALRKHFKELHEKEQKKRVARLESLRKGGKMKKANKFKERERERWERYKEAARPILVPKIGFGLESDLRRAGVFVRTVESKPQAADLALQRRMAESMNSGIRCLCLVSDDTDFAPVLARARSLDLATVVFGESPSLRRHAHVWFPWNQISQGAMPRNHLEDAARSVVGHYAAASAAAPAEEATSGWYQKKLGVEEDEDEDEDEDVEHKVYDNEAKECRTSAFSEEEEDEENEAKECRTSAFSEEEEEDEETEEEEAHHHHRFSFFL